MLLQNQLNGPDILTAVSQIVPGFSGVAAQVNSPGDVDAALLAAWFHVSIDLI